MAGPTAAWDARRACPGAPSLSFMKTASADSTLQRPAPTESSALRRVCAKQATANNSTASFPAGSQEKRHGETKTVSRHHERQLNQTRPAQTVSPHGPPDKHPGNQRQVGKAGCAQCLVLRLTQSCCLVSPQAGALESRLKAPPLGTASYRETLVVCPAITCNTHGAGAPALTEWSCCWMREAAGPKKDRGL